MCSEWTALTCNNKVEATANMYSKPIKMVAETQPCVLRQLLPLFNRCNPAHHRLLLGCCPCCASLPAPLLSPPTRFHLPSHSRPALGLWLRSWGTGSNTTCSKPAGKQQRRTQCMHETCYQHHLPPFQPGPQLVAELVETGSGTICWKPAGEQHETCETVVGWIRYGPCNSIGNVAEIMGHRQ